MLAIEEFSSKLVNTTQPLVERYLEVIYVLWTFIIHNPAQKCTKILMLGYRKALTLV